MSNPFQRRRFIQQLMALTGAHLIGGCGSDTNGTGGAGGTGSGGSGGGGGSGGSGGNGKRVIVIGAGLAGMCAAYELRKKGYEIAAVLEAQDRVGGRVLTVRDGFKNGQYGEAGATRIADTHNFTLAYAQQFNLTLREFTGGTPLYYVKGKPPFQHADGDPWPTDVFNFPTAEQQMGKGADSIIFDYEKLDELGDPLAADWPTGKALDYNDMGIEDYLRANGANDDVIALDRAINGTELKFDSALFWLMADVVDAKWDKTYAIAGGNDQLPKAFAASLGDLIKLKSEVTAIATTDNGVTVTYKDAQGMMTQIAGDLCVVSIPFSTLRKITITPDVSAAKRNVIDNLSMMPVGRCFLQTKSRFWNKNGLGGLKVARTDTYMERFWDATNVQDGETGILLSYMMADNALAFGMQPEGTRVDYVAKKAAEFFPEIMTELDNGYAKAWQEDQWSSGGWAYYKSGEMKDMFPAAKKTEGRLHFCGEHTSAWGGWMQGALESANRVVADITTG